MKPNEARFDVTGMSCAACAAHIEKAALGVPGVRSASVSLLTNSMIVESDEEVTAEQICRAVDAAGYGAVPAGDRKTEAQSKRALPESDTPALIRRLIISAVLLLPLMYVSMGHTMWGWPVPAFLSMNPVGIGLYELIVAAVICFVNRAFFINGFKALIRRAPNMDTLVAMGSGVSFIYSTVLLFIMTAESPDAAMARLHSGLYFESAAMIVTLITVGKTLESWSKGKTTDALRGLMELAPDTAVVIRDGRETEIPAEDVVTGDVFIVRPGASVPVDGVIIEGQTAIDESALTGESVPVDKSPGSAVSAATVNTEGFIRCRATKVGADTTLSKIIELVENTAATKAPVARLADKVSGIFVPAVIAAAVLVTVIWLIIGKGFPFALTRGISVLVVSCPCALGLATPVAVMAGSGVGARNGILFKTAASLEAVGKTRIIALDKTGTVTMGRPVVTDVIPADGVSGTELLLAAAAAEKGSEHPLARAVTEYAGEDIPDCSDFKAIPGRGVSSVVNGAHILGGNKEFIGAGIDSPMPELIKTGESLAAQGKTPLYFAKDGSPLGIIAVADAVKPDSADAVQELKNMGVTPVLLTGDNARTAAQTGRQTGIEHIVSGVLPGDKAEIIGKLQRFGQTAMVGDGINDAPALTAADSGIAIGAGTDIAIDAADVVLVNSGLSDAAAAVRLSRAVLRNVKQNLFWAFFYNIICIPIAAGALSRFGVVFEPMYGAAAMSLSSFFVCMNALRLNLVDIRSPKRDKKTGKDDITIEGVFPEKEQIKEETKMTKTIKVDGMMCKNCVAHVKKALEALDGVEAAEVSLENADAVLTLGKEVDDAVIEAAVTDAGYSVKI